MYQLTPADLQARLERPTCNCAHARTQHLKAHWLVPAGASQFWKLWRRPQTLQWCPEWSVAEHAAADWERRAQRCWLGQPRGPCTWLSRVPVNLESQARHLRRAVVTSEPEQMYHLTPADLPGMEEHSVRFCSVQACTLPVLWQYSQIS